MLTPTQLIAIFNWLLVTALVGTLLGGRTSASSPFRSLVPLSLISSYITIQTYIFAGVTAAWPPNTIVLSSPLTMIPFMMAIVLSSTHFIFLFLELRSRKRAIASAILTQGSAALACAFAVVTPLYAQKILDGAA